MEESSVEMVLRFSKEKGVEDLGLEVWHLFFCKHLL
jgi:hypothetical protein